MNFRGRHNFLGIRGAGFTMIELIVVSVLMVVLAAVIVPRVVVGASRKARGTAEAVRDLVSAAGQREAMTSQAVTLAFESDAPGGGRLSLLRSTEPGRAPTPDPLVQPVSLDGLEIERCEAAGQPLNPRRWQIPLREGDIRPSIAVTLRQSEGGRWLVSLPSEAVSATLVEVGTGEATRASTSGAIDLDRTGRRGEAW